MVSPFVFFVPTAYISIEHDSGIESLDSLSPKDIDNTPLNSPEVVASVPTPTPSAIQVKMIFLLVNIL